jgi:hypothetical protein
VQPSIGVPGRLKRLLDHVVAGKLVLPDGLVDADDILPHHTPSANVQVADLRVTHQTLGQADSERRGFELGEARGALGQFVHDGRLGCGDGIAVLWRLVRGNAPAVNYD